MKADRVCGDDLLAPPRLWDTAWHSGAVVWLCWFKRQDLLISGQSWFNNKRGRKEGLADKALGSCWGRLDLTPR